MDGLDLIKTMISATGLPQQSAQQVLDDLLSRAGLQKENLTLDDLREVLSVYMQDILLSAQEEFSEP